MTPAQFLARLSQGGVPAVALLLGSEPYDRQRCREALVAAHLTEEERTGGITQYDLSEIELSQVVDDARSLSLFTSRRVIFATGAEAVLPRSGKGDEDGDEGSAITGAGGSVTRELAAYVASPTPGTVLLLESGRFAWEGDEKKKNERVRKFFEAVPDVVELRPYAPDEARKLLDELARQAGLRLSPEVAGMLGESLGGSAGRIATEIEKLSLFAEAGTVTVEQIAELVPDARETTIFALVNALGRRDRVRSLGVLDTLCRSGEYLPLALSFLSGQFRLALMASEANLKSAGQVQSHFSKQGVPMWGSRAEQVAQTASKFSRSQLERALRLIFAADRDLRSARPDDRVVLERLVVELTAT